MEHKAIFWKHPIEGIEFSQDKKAYDRDGNEVPLDAELSYKRIVGEGPLKLRKFPAGVAGVEYGQDGLPTQAYLDQVKKEYYDWYKQQKVREVKEEGARVFWRYRESEFDPDQTKLDQYKTDLKAAFDAKKTEVINNLTGDPDIDIPYLESVTVDWPVP